MQKKKGLTVLAVAYILAALIHGPSSGYSISLLYKTVMSAASRGNTWVFPILAFPWVLFLAAGLFLYLKEEGRNARAFFILLLGYVTLFQLPHPWILELMLLTPKESWLAISTKR